MTSPWQRPILRFPRVVWAGRSGGPGAFSLGSGCLSMRGLFCTTKFFGGRKGIVVPNSVLEAINLGVWDFEPEEVEVDDYTPTSAMPGTCEKLEVLAERVQQGLPLWHYHDRRSFDDAEYD